MASLGKHFNINSDDLIANSKVTFKGVNYRITVLTDRLIRFEYSLDGTFYDGATEMVHKRNFDVPKIKAEQDDKFLVITTKYFIMQYAKEKPFKGPSFAPDSNLKVKLVNTDKIWYFNHPEARNFKGSAKSLDDYGDKTTLSNGLYSTDGFATLDDSNGLIIDEDGFIIPNDKKRIDLYLFIYRRDFGLCLKDYFNLTGYPPMIPRYALGVWWNKDAIYNYDDTTKIIQAFKKNDIPISVFLLSEFWHRKDKNNYNLYKTGYTFNDELFPEPKKFIKFMHDNNVYVGLNLDSKEGINAFETNYLQMCDELNVSNQKLIPFRIFDKNFVVSYFNNLINPLYELGIDFFWLDNKDDLPLRALQYYHFNDYKRFNSKRGMLLSRNGNKASHLYPVHYSGETNVSWDTLKYLPYFNLTASNIGITWWSHDVGGFKDGIEDSELYIRNVEFACFSPIFRFSSKRGAFYKREPWRWDVKTYTIAKKYTTLRHRLIPYIYTENYKYHKMCLPLIQPIYYYYPQIIDEPEYKNEYYFGTELLVAPITKPKDEYLNRSIEKIFLPKGIWYDLASGKKFVGNKRYISFYKEDEYPVFAKSGAIIPMSIIDNDINNTKPSEKMEIQIFPGTSNVYRMYEDDGVSSLYEDGYYIITDIDFNYRSDNYDLTIQPVEGKTNIIPEYRDYKIRFRNTRLPEKVVVEINNKLVDDYKYYTDENDLIVEVSRVDTKRKLHISCMGRNIEISAVRIINEDIFAIISDLKIETRLKEQLANLLFSNLDIKKKRINVKKLKSSGLSENLIKMFLRLLEYISEL